MARGHRAELSGVLAADVCPGDAFLTGGPCYAARDGLVRRLVDAEDLRQPGDPEDLQDPLLVQTQVQRAVVGPHPPQAPDQHPEAGGVEEPDLSRLTTSWQLPVLTRSMSSSRSRGAVYISISPCTSMTSMPSLAW